MFVYKYDLMVTLIIDQFSKKTFYTLLLYFSTFVSWNLYRNKYGDGKVHKFPGITEAAEVYCKFVFLYLPHTFHQRV